MNQVAKTNLCTKLTNIKIVLTTESVPVVAWCYTRDIYASSCRSVLSRLWDLMTQTNVNKTIW